MTVLERRPCRLSLASAVLLAVAYSPTLHVEGRLTRDNQAEVVMLDEVTYQHASLVRT